MTSCTASFDGRDRLLEVEGLQTFFDSDEGTTCAVDRVSFRVSLGETFGLVGESGSGKSVTALSILGLISSPPGRIGGGSVLFRGEDLLCATERRMTGIRGNEIAMIFQDPMTSLNPVFTVGHQISEAIVHHKKVSRREAFERTIEMLRLVHIPEPERRAEEYPHQLSGGMRQRVMIAMALSCDPKILIADEPTTALDVTIQAQILDLIRELQDRLGTAIILISHDLGVIAETADRVAVMYAGRKVEDAAVEDLFLAPCHPYTKGLLASVPRLDAMGSAEGARARLKEIKGSITSLADLPHGCSFAPRCPLATPQCEQSSPPLEEKRPGHWAACWHSDAMTP